MSLKVGLGPHPPQGVFGCAAPLVGETKTFSKEDSTASVPEKIAPEMMPEMTTFHSESGSDESGFATCPDQTSGALGLLSTWPSRTEMNENIGFDLNLFDPLLGQVLEDEIMAASEGLPTAIAVGEGQGSEPAPGAPASTIEDIWGAGSLCNDLPFGDDGMLMRNPYEVEGRFDPRSEVQKVEETVPVNAHLDDAHTSLIEEILNMQVQPAVAPEIHEEEDYPDLLKFVIDETICADSDEVANFLRTADEISTHSSGGCSSVNSIIEEKLEADSTSHIKRRGRPPKLDGQALSLRTPDSSSEDQNNGSCSRKRVLTEMEKYRRIRELNNAASRRCRVKRKLKMQTLTDEENRLTKKNQDLKLELKAIQHQVNLLKKRFVEAISKPSTYATSSATISSE